MHIFFIYIVKNIFIKYFFFFFLVKGGWGFGVWGWGFGVWGLAQFPGGEGVG